MHRLKIPASNELQPSTAFMAQITGAFYIAGAALVVIANLLPHPAGGDELAVFVIAALGAVSGAGLILVADGTRLWMIHGATVAASLLVCLTMILTGVAAGVYSLMFVWVVLVSSFCFPGRRAAAHLAILLVGYAVTLVLVDSPEFSPYTRWILTAVVLGTSSAVSSWLVGGLREGALRQETLRTEAESLARTDPLTGLPNRRWLEDELEREIGRAARHSVAVWVAIVDLDHFKAFNDRFGHVAGDALLSDAATEWRAAVRGSDFLARVGGDEFIVLLAGCETEDARRIVNRLRAATPLGQRCCVGMARWDGAETSEALIDRADHALYSAKTGGRNRVVLDPAGIPDELGFPAAPEARAPSI